MPEDEEPFTRGPTSAKRANELEGREWTRYSISVWNDIRLSSDERALKHPAMFPSMLAERVIQCFTRSEQCHVLDPFMGSGSTLVAAHRLGRSGIGFELYENFVALAKSRLRQLSLLDSSATPAVIHQQDCRRVVEVLGPESIDLCVTSPPYWDILRQKRTADYKEAEDYGDSTSDIGTIPDYERYLDALEQVFGGVYEVLKPGSYCVINVMDLRKKSVFFPLHADLSNRLKRIGFIFDDLIIWDRRADYNNLRPLGYPYVFRINKVHEYLLIFQKPKAQ